MGWFSKWYYLCIRSLISFIRICSTLITYDESRGFFGIGIPDFLAKIPWDLKFPGLGFFRWVGFSSKKKNTFGFNSRILTSKRMIWSTDGFFLSASTRTRRLEWRKWWPRRSLAPPALSGRAATWPWAPSSTAPAELIRKSARATKRSKMRLKLGLKLPSLPAIIVEQSWEIQEQSFF